MTYPFVQSAVDLGPARGPRLALVVHMAEGGGTVGYLSRANPNGVSVHFVVERSGRTVQMLDLARIHSSLRSSAIRTTDDPDGLYGVTAARAVMGKWADTRASLGPNHASIGLEIEGFARDGPNAAQGAALAALFADLAVKSPGIRALAHRDFASYKACPGKLIRWQDLGGHGPRQAAPRSQPVTEEGTMPLPITEAIPKLVDLAVGTQIYRLDGTTPLVKLSSGGTDLWSPFASGINRAVRISTGGLVQLVLVRTAACKNVRPVGASGVTTSAFNDGVTAASVAALTARKP